MAGIRELQSSGAKWNVFEEYCGNVCAHIAIISKRLAGREDASAEEKLETVRTLKDCAEELEKVDIEARERSKQTEELCSQLRRKHQQGESLEDVVELHKQGADAAARAASRSVRNSNHDVKDVIQIFKSLENADGSGDEIQENLASSQPNTRKCPILGCEIVDAVRNAECGHVYSVKGAISMLFQNNAPRARTIPDKLDQVPEHFRARCPNHACDNIVTRRSLRKDYSTALSQRQMQKSASMRRDSMEVEELV